MGAPVGGVAFSRAAVPAWREEVEGYVGSVASCREGDDFWVTRMVLPTWSYEGTERPFILNLDDRGGEFTLPWESDGPYGSDWTQASYHAAFGLLPDQQVVLSAMCKDPED